MKDPENFAARSRASRATGAVESTPAMRRLFMRTRPSNPGLQLQTTAPQGSQTGGLVAPRDYHREEKE
jgi:hypothetical protein